MVKPRAGVLGVMGPFSCTPQDLRYWSGSYQGVWKHVLAHSEECLLHLRCCGKLPNPPRFLESPLNAFSSIWGFWCPKTCTNTACPSKAVCIDWATVEGGGTHGPGIASAKVMNCPLCNVALKAAGYRRVDVNYCPLCGGTWLDRWGYENLSENVTPAKHHRPRWLRITILTALVLAGCLLAVVSVGAVKLWPTVRSWTGAVLSGEGTALTSEVQRLAGRLADPQIQELRRSGLDSTAALRADRQFGF